MRRSAFWCCVSILGAACAKEAPPPMPAPPPVPPPTGPIFDQGPTTAADHLPRAAIVTIDATSIGIDGVSILPLPSDRSRGADAAYKRSGPNDLLLVPLKNALERAKAEGKIGDRVEIVLTSDTPYRVLMEVLFTAGQSTIGRYELHEGSLHGRHLSTTPPSLGRRPGLPLPQSSDELPPGPPTLNLSVLFTSEGIALKTSTGNVAPGCAARGKGVAIPHVGGKPDLASLVACARKLHAEDPAFAEEKEFTFAANAGTPFDRVADVVLALVTPGLFDEFHFAVLR